MLKATSLHVHADVAKVDELIAAGTTLHLSLPAVVSFVSHMKLLEGRREAALCNQLLEVSDLDTPTLARQRQGGAHRRDHHDVLRHHVAILHWIPTLGQGRGCF